VVEVTVVEVTLRPSLKLFLFAVTRPTHWWRHLLKKIWVGKKHKTLGRVTANQHNFKDGLTPMIFAAKNRQKLFFKSYKPSTVSVLLF
jgi:hypothetical protein